MIDGADGGLMVGRTYFLSLSLTLSREAGYVGYGIMTLV